MSYPPVLDEAATLDAVLAGRSLARIGDGELKLATGRSIKAQAWNPEIAAWLVRIARGDGPCLVGVPRVGDYEPPKERAAYVSFCRQPRHVALYGAGGYGSAFISRPDCAPHIDCAPYWAKLRSLWVGRDVVLVRGSGKGLTPRDMLAAGRFEEVKAPPIEAWGVAEDLFQRLKGETRIVLLCLGAVATVLAWRLAEAGVHAVDLGGVGRFMRASRQAREPAAFPPSADRT